jgi:hypothetical protein
MSKWLTFQEAVDIVRAQLGGAIGRAEAVVKAARTSGEVRFSDPIRPVLLLADDGLVGMSLRPGAQGKAGIARDGTPRLHRSVVADSDCISKDDLLDWLNRNQTDDAKHGTPATSAKPAKRLSPKQRALRDAIRACFPDDVPDDVEMPNGPLTATLASWLKVHRPAVAMMSDKTILRAVGRAR